MSVTWATPIRNWAASDTPTGAILAVEVVNRLDYIKARKPEFFAATDEGKHLEFGVQNVTVLSGATNGQATVTFNTAFISVTPTIKVSAASVDTGAWWVYALAISSTATTIVSRHYLNSAAGADKTIPAHYLAVG